MAIELWNRARKAARQLREKWNVLVEWIRKKRNPENIPDCSANEKYIAEAEAFSVFSGVKIITEDEKKEYEQVTEEGDLNIITEDEKNEEYVQVTEEAFSPIPDLNIITEDEKNEEYVQVTEEAFSPMSGVEIITADIACRKIEECEQLTAKALSAIKGVPIITEDEALLKIKTEGVQVKPLSIRDVFYGTDVDPSWDEDNETEKLYYVPNSEYDPDYDYDFTDYKGDDTNCTRGGYPYKRPAGWNRKAVNVKKPKYKDTVWLGQDGWRDGSSPGEWAVSYHGTKIQNVPSIVAGGYDTKKSKRRNFGPGIYSTPDFNVAEDYAKDFDYKGENYKCILQNRVNLKNTEVVDSRTYEGIYFVTENEDDIRPYGVCLKKTERKS